jgi:hypothetical protein
VLASVTVFGFVVEPVQSASKRLVEVAQVIRQREYKPKLLRDFEVKVRQDIEGKVQLLMKSTCVSFELRSDYDDLRSQCPHLGMDFL